MRSYNEFRVYFRIRVISDCHYLRSTRSCFLWSKIQDSVIWLPLQYLYWNGVVGHRIRNLGQHIVYSALSAWTAHCGCWFYTHLPDHDRESAWAAIRGSKPWNEPSYRQAWSRFAIALIQRRAWAAAAHRKVSAVFQLEGHHSNEVMAWHMEQVWTVAVSVCYWHFKQ